MVGFYRTGCPHTYTPERATPVILTCKPYVFLSKLGRHPMQHSEHGKLYVPGEKSSRHERVPPPPCHRRARQNAVLVATTQISPLIVSWRAGRAYARSSAVWRRSLARGGRWRRRHGRRCRRSARGKQGTSRHGFYRLVSFCFTLQREIIE